MLTSIADQTARDTITGARAATREGRTIPL
jgi:hypothetical protein